jgi:hypothetical protein
MKIAIYSWSVKASAQPTPQQAAQASTVAAP